MTLTSVGILLQMPDGSQSYIHSWATYTGVQSLTEQFSSSNPVGGDRASQAAERDCWESLFRGDRWGYAGGIWWRGFLVWFYSMPVSLYIYIHVLSPYISYRKICFSLQSSSIQFMQAQDPTVKKILDFESNLCGIEGLPTCNLDKCKVSYFSSLHIHSKIAGVDQAPGISSSHTSDTPVRLSGGSKSMAWVIWW